MTLRIDWFKLGEGNHMRQTHIVDSWTFGPTVWISGWVHGDEHFWVKVTKDFLRRVQVWELILLKWRIPLILAWNEEALLLSQRWIDSWNKHDLNRVVDAVPDDEKEDSYTQNRWWEIKQLIDTMMPSAWLDLHSFSAPVGLPYAFSSINGYKSIWKDLGIQNMAVNMGNANKKSSGWVRKWSGVSDYVNASSGHGFTFEAWPHKEPACLVATYQALINFLVSQDMLEPKKVWLEGWKVILHDHNDIVPIWWGTSSHVHIESRHNFVWGFEYKWAHPQSFQEYKKGDIIGYDIHTDETRTEIRAEFDGHIILPKNPDVCTLGNEVFYYGKNMSEIV